MKLTDKSKEKDLEMPQKDQELPQMLLSLFLESKTKLIELLKDKEVEIELMLQKDLFNNLESKMKLIDNQPKKEIYKDQEIDQKDLEKFKDPPKDQNKLLN